MAGNPRPQKSIYTDEYDALLRLLVAARKRAGLTQMELAKRLGYTQSNVSKFERGDRRLDVIQLRTMLRQMNLALPRFAEQLERELSRAR